MEENHPLNCQEFYEASRVCGEMLLQALYNREQRSGSGFEFVCLRYMNVNGARQDDKVAYVGFIIRMVNALNASEQPVIHGDGSQSYDFIDVRDCAKANVLAMQSEASNQYLNVGSGTKTSIAEHVALLSARHPNKNSARFKPGERPNVRNRVGDTEKSSREINFSVKVDLGEGLCDIIHWRINQPHGGGT